MTVRDLISELEKIDNKDMKVVVISSNFEQNNSLILATSLRKFDGILRNQTFRDAFDGDTYSKEIVKMSFSDSDHNEEFVQIF